MRGAALSARFVIPSIVLALFTAWPARAGGQIRMEVDQGTGAVRFAEPANYHHLIDSVDANTYRLRHSATVHVRVVNTNTALYQFSAQDEEATLQSMQSVRTFAPLLKDYLPELGLLFRPGPRATHGRGGPSSALPDAIPAGTKEATRALADDALSAGRDIDGILLQLQDLEHGSRGVDGVHGLTLRTLDRMRGGEVESQADALADSLAQPRSSCSTSRGRGKQGKPGKHLTSLGIAGSLLVLFDTLKPATATLSGLVSDDSVRADPALQPMLKQLMRRQATADSALARRDSIVTQAYAVEDLAGVVMQACSFWDAPEVNVSTTGGHVISLKIDPRPEPDLQRVATDHAAAPKITFLAPISRIGASFGISALFSPQAQYPIYDVRAVGASASPVQVYEKSPPNDQRFSYGATFGLTYYPWLDHRGNNPWGIAVWLPEITVAEAGGRAFGLGTAVSVGPLKLGVGGLLVRHMALDGDTLSQPLINDKYLKVRNIYGRPTTYFSITVIDLPKLLGLVDGDKPAAKPSAPAAKSPKE